MSLILDALRKSEAERRRGQAPDLFAPAPYPLPVAAPPAARTPWLPLAIAAGLVVAAVTAWRLLSVAPAAGGATPVVAAGAMQENSGTTIEPVSRQPPALAGSDSNGAGPVPVQAGAPSRSPSPHPVPPPVTAIPASGTTGTVSGAPQASMASVSPGTTPATPPAPSRPRADPSGPAAGSLPDPALVAAAAAAVAMPVRPADPAQAALRPTPSTAPSTPVATTRPAGAGAPVAVASARAAMLPAPPANDGLLRLSELPSAERSQLPPLKMSMHMWSPDAAQRFVILDGSRVGQGDRVGEAVVEEITRDSAVLAWRGRRLQVPLR